MLTYPQTITNETVDPGVVENDNVIKVCVGGVYKEVGKALDQ